MAVPQQYMHKYAYHFTSIRNLPSIIRSGLLSTNLKNAQQINHVDVAHSSIQQRRSEMRVPGSQRVVHDYVPFYFAKRTPMQLAVLNKKNVDQEFIIYFAVSISILDQRNGVFFTDSSANTSVPPAFFDSTHSGNLANLRWDLIDALQWAYGDRERNQKMAELLVPDSVSMQEVSHIVVWDESYRHYVTDVFRQAGMHPPQIILDEFHYFRDLSTNECLVTGPVLLKRAFEETVDRVISSRVANPRFSGIDSALASVKQDFSVIQELRDIDGLAADYGPHKDDVGTHSRRVASLVVISPEYQRLSPHNKALLEMAAFLHDIGKGPKSRWPNSHMNRSDANHSKKSLPMLERILTREIGGLPTDSVRRLIMLVTYDDLPGDIASQGRDIQQLYDIITSEDDINMLVALSKADIGAINGQWLLQQSANIDCIRARVLAQL